MIEAAKLQQQQHERVVAVATEVEVKMAPVVSKVYDNAVDDQLRLVPVLVKAMRKGALLTVETLNEQPHAVRILTLTLSGQTQKGETVVVDLTQTGPYVVSTQCNTFASHRLQPMWTQSCVVELASSLQEHGRVTAGGISQQNDGAHSVIGSTSF